MRFERLYFSEKVMGTTTELDCVVIGKEEDHGGLEDYQPNQCENQSLPFNPNYV